MKKPIRVATALAALLALTLCLAGCGSPNVEKTPEPVAPAASQQQSDKDEEAADSQEKEEKAAKENPKASQESAEQDSKAPAEKASSKKDSSTSSKATASQAKDQKKASKKPGADSKKSASSKNSSSTAKKPASNSSNSSSSSNGSNSSGSSPSNSQEKPQAPATKTIQVTVSIDGAGYIAAVKGKKVELEEGSTVFDALKKVATSIGGNKRYVSSINGLAEKEHGALSGWMYDVNGSTPMVPCGQYELKNGDSVLWHYENAQD